MWRARRLLATQEYSVKEVAYDLGFRDPSHFCKVFHSLVGTTPNHSQKKAPEAVANALRDPL